MGLRPGLDDEGDSGGEQRGEPDGSPDRSVRRRSDAVDGTGGEAAEADHGELEHGERVPLAGGAASGPVSWASAFAMPADATFPPDLSTLVDRCLEGEGVTGAAVIDRATGVCLAYRGTGLSADIAWAHLHSLNVIARHERVEEAIVITATHFHFIRLIRPDSEHLVYAVVDAPVVLLAMARVALHRAIDSWRPSANEAS